MSDKNNELQPGGGSSSEALQRAERIRAIKNSIRKSSEPQTQPDALPADTAAEAETAPVQQEEAAASSDNWESELAARIAKRVQKVKSSKKTSSAESILNELDGIIASNEEVIDNAADIQDEHDSEPETAPEEEYDEVQGQDESEAAEEAEDAENETKAVETEDSPKKKKAKVKKKKKKKKKKNFKERLLGILPQKKDSVGERVRKIVFLGSITACIVLGCIIADYYIDIYSTEGEYEDIIIQYNRDSSSDYEVSKDEYYGEYYTMLPGAERLMKINNEVIGVINIPDTQVNYPVMQSGDLVKYLDKNINGEKAKAGSLFMDYRNSFDRVVDGKLVEENSDNLIIYGHNMESGMMFGSLKNYRNNVNYYGEHPIIELNSNYAYYKYKIFAFFIIDAEDETETAFECWNKINFTDEEDFYNFVNEAKRRTIRLNDVDVKYGDKLLTLSTCNGIFGEHGPGRLIVMARLVREGEDLLEGTQNSVANPNIKWPSLYYTIRKNEKYDPDAEFVPYNETAEEETTSEE